MSKKLSFDYIYIKGVFTKVKMKTYKRKIIFNYLKHFSTDLMLKNSLNYVIFPSSNYLISKSTILKKL
jgi:hypothetical protein